MTYRESLACAGCRREVGLGAGIQVAEANGGNRRLCWDCWVERCQQSGEREMLAECDHEPFREAGL